MIQHNFKVSIRQMLKNKVYSFINIGGLAMGLVVTLLIGLWVHDELSYNKYNRNYDSVVQLLRQGMDNGEIETGEVLTTGMATVLAESFPDHFEKVVLVRARVENRVIGREETKFTEAGYFMQDGAIQMFDLNMLLGGYDGLKDPKSILLSQTVAQKLFKDENPIGQLVKFDGEEDLFVTGVYEDLPKNSTFHRASYIAPIELYIGENNAAFNVWNNYNMYVYAQLSPNADPDFVSSRVTEAFKPHFNDWAKRSGMEFFLHPMRDFHLYSEFKNGQPAMSQSLQFVWLYGIIGAFVLALACINFMNLSTARSEKRAKEVGIRKTIGSNRKQLIIQFYIESFLYSVLAFVISIGLASVLLPWFNYTAGKALVAPWGSVNFWLISVGIVLLTTILAGSYPAIYLSSFNPVKAIKGTKLAGKRASIPRKVLVVFQFTISVALIIATLTIFQQIDLAKNRPVGYSPEGMLSIRPATPELENVFPVLVEEFKRTGYAEYVGGGNYPVTNTLGWNDGFSWEGMPEGFDAAFNTVRTTYEYADAVGMQWIEGRNFSRDFGNDSEAILINRSAMELMQLENPVGTLVTREYSWREPRTFQIIGVVEDMIKGSPFEKTYPSILFLDESNLNWLFIRLNPNVSTQEAIPALEEVFTSILPNAPFDFQFADYEYALKFDNEERMANLATFLCGLAVLISCLGLFGLASYVAEQRTKEIGIRKVLGATVANLWRLLSRDFVFLVLIACAISIPLSYQVLDGWLQNYEVSTPLHWWFFALAVGIAFLITLATVSFQSIKVAMANPVNSLRSE